MMISTGIDLVSVKRIEESIRSTPRFIAKFFGSEEQKIFRSKVGNKALSQTIAGNFAAKEAFSKAIGTGIRDFSLIEVEVLRDNLGAPYFMFSGKAQQIVLLEKLKFSVSLSHTDEYATAVVIAYKI